MKKQTLLLMAGGMLAIASCNNNAGDAGMSQASIDSMVNARVEEIRTEMMKQNDSLINALATIKADSIIEAMKSGNKPASKPAAKPTTKNSASTKGSTPEYAPANTPTKPGGLKGHSDQNQTGGGLKAHSDQNKANSGGLKSHSDQATGK